MQTVEALKMGFDSCLFFEVLFIYFVSKIGGCGCAGNGKLCG